MVDSPHSIFPGMDEGDYYRGTFKQPASEQPDFHVEESALRDLAAGESLVEEDTK